MSDITQGADIRFAIDPEAAYASVKVYVEVARGRFQFVITQHRQDGTILRAVPHDIGVPRIEIECHEPPST